MTAPVCVVRTFPDESIASASSTRCPSAPRRLARSTATYRTTSRIDSNHILPAIAVRSHSWVSIPRAQSPHGTPTGHYRYTDSPARFAWAPPCSIDRGSKENTDTKGEHRHKMQCLKVDGSLAHVVNPLSSAQAIHHRQEQIPCDQKGIDNPEDNDRPSAKACRRIMRASERP